MSLDCQAVHTELTNIVNERNKALARVKAAETAFTPQIKWWAPQEQLILSWVRSLFAAGGWARRSKDITGGNVLMRCGSNLRARTRAMLVDRAQPPFTHTGIADLGLLRGMIPQRERLRSTRL